MMELSRRLEKELREERAASEGLGTNIKFMKGKLEAAEKCKEECMQRIGELEDQVWDLMFFIDAKSKFESGEGVGAEPAGGMVEGITWSSL
jgi:BRCA1-associated protein